MEDLSNEMVPGKRVSAKMRALLNKEENEARKRIVDRGIVHFRADKEFMETLLDAADRLKMAPGTLCRRIVWEHLKSLPATGPVESVRVELPPDVGEVLIQKLDAIQELLSQAMRDQTSGRASFHVQEVASLASELKDGQDEIRGELKEIRAHLLGVPKKTKNQ